MSDSKPWHLHWRRYRLPFRHPVRTAHGVWTEREGVWVQLADDQGAAGWGEAAPLAWFGAGTAAEMEAQLASLGDAVTPESWRARNDLAGPVRFALAMAETALRGGDAAPVRAHWPVAGLLPAGRPALAVVMDQLEAGFRTFKWKVGVGDPADERGLLDDLLARLPTGARLRLDANGAWDRRTAERWLAVCAERPIEFVEQPVAPAARGAEDVLLGLAGDYPTPIALDESLVRRGDLHRWCALGWPGVWVVKLSLLGEPTEVFAALRAAQADVVFSSALETGLGAAASLAAAFTWPGEVRALGYGVWPLFADRAFDGPARAPFIRAVDLRYEPAEPWAALVRS